MQLLLVIGVGLFVLLTTGSILLSLKYLGNTRDYRFYRFFAYEVVLAQFLFNLNRLAITTRLWKEALFWAGICLSLITLITGYLQLKKVGDPSGSIENTTHFVDMGVFHWIRHPFYASFLFFASGLFFKSVSIFNAFLLVAAGTLLFLTARFEETENIRKFGSAYQDYIKETKMFIPFLF